MVSAITVDSHLSPSLSNVKNVTEEEEEEGIEGKEDQLGFGALIWKYFDNQVRRN